MESESARMGACFICKRNRAKYRCPRCETVTCSLLCCKAHKRLKGYCDGIRDKTKFVPMEKITSMDIASGKCTFLIFQALKCVILSIRLKLSYAKLCASFNFYFLITIL